MPDSIPSAISGRYPIFFRSSTALPAAAFEYLIFDGNFGPYF